MIYQKPKDVSYTEMAIFIDNNAYKEDCSEETNNLIFKYLYLLIEMLAFKAQFFQKYQYYEDFALEVATSVYMRLKNKRQFKYKPNGEPQLKPIKSVLNYIKKILYPRKVKFEQTYYDQSFITIPLNYDVGIRYTFADSLIDSLDCTRLVDFELCLDDITRTIKHYISILPFKNDTIFTTNLYLSCLLTFISMITVKNSELQRLANLKIKSHSDIDVADLVQDKFCIDDVILYDIDASFKKYVFLLANKLKHLIAQDLSTLLRTRIHSESTIKSFIINDVIQYTMNQERVEKQ